MQKSCLGISIPEELVRYAKRDENSLVKEHVLNLNFVSKVNQSDVVIKRNEHGAISSVLYYTDWRELCKEVFYSGALVVKVVHYRNEKRYIEEEFRENRLEKKRYYEKNGKVSSVIKYEYNKKGYIVSLLKYCNDKKIIAQYDYDDLDRVNQRKIYVDNNLISEQYYCYDILDRLLEYRDANTKILVKNINPKNKLISYKITDKIGNNISVTNKFDGDTYVATDIDINGHQSKIKDIKYVDNIMLKKPCTTEDDLDMIISNLLREESSVPMTTSRANYSQVLDKSSSIIEGTITYKAVPIALRKRIMLSIANSV